MSVQFLKKEDGISLFEALIVLAIISLVSGLGALTVASSQKSRESRAEILTIESILSNAKLASLLKQKTQIVSINLQKREIKNSANKEIYELPTSLEIVLKTAENDFKNTGEFSIKFFGNGQSTGGEFILQHGKIDGRIFINWIDGTITSKIEVRNES